MKTLKKMSTALAGAILISSLAAVSVSAAEAESDGVLHIEIGADGGFALPGDSDEYESEPITSYAEKSEDYGNSILPDTYTGSEAVPDTNSVLPDSSYSNNDSLMADNYYYIPEQADDESYPETAEYGNNYCESGECHYFSGVYEDNDIDNEIYYNDGSNDDYTEYITADGVLVKVFKPQEMPKAGMVSENMTHYIVNVKMETKNYEESVDELYRLFDRYNAEIFSSGEYGNSYTDVGDTRTALFVVKVPVERYQDMNKEMVYAGHIVRDEVFNEDFTRQYSTNNARLEALYLEKNSTYDYQRLADVNAEIVDYELDSREIEESINTAVFKIELNTVMAEEDNEESAPTIEPVVIRTGDDNSVPPVQEDNSGIMIVILLIAASVAAVVIIYKAWFEYKDEDDDSDEKDNVVDGEFTKVDEKESENENKVE